MKLRGGHEATDPRLGRVPSFDPRSRRFPIRALHEGKPLRSRGWHIGTILDQGDSPSCVGHAWAHELIASPVQVAMQEPDALALYREAQQLDEWAGEAYEGSSTLGGAKAVQARGLCREYRWCFSLEDVLLAVGYEGPVVVGSNWYESMFDPDPKGRVAVGGEVAGGHEWLVVSVRLASQTILAANSWGRSWGLAGRFVLSFDDLERLLADQGDACCPVGRSRP